MHTENKNFNYEKLQILYKDEALVVIFKPAGLLSVPFSGSKGKTALSVLENQMRSDGTWKTGFKPFAVHRLDKETSGVMMFALTEQAQKKIMNNWQTLVKERRYRAVSENPHFKSPARNIAEEGIIDSPLAQNAYHEGYVPQNAENVKTVDAKTHYKILKQGDAYTLFELELETGRKNQIRAHLASIKYPIAGDRMHKASGNPFGRLALHAVSLVFEHPYTKEIMKFEVEEPSNWLSTVQKTKYFDRERKNQEEVVLSCKHLSRKKAAHMNYIERGQYLSKMRGK